MEWFVDAWVWIAGGVGVFFVLGVIGALQGQRERLAEMSPEEQKVIGDARRDWWLRVLMAVGAVALGVLVVMYAEPVIYGVVAWLWEQAWFVQMVAWIEVWGLGTVVFYGLLGLVIVYGVIKFSHD